MNTALVNALAHAWRSAPLLDSAVWSLEHEVQAYAVQDGLAQALGWQLAGRPQFWKAGAASRQHVPGFAPLAPHGVRGANASFADLPWPTRGVEAEIALRLGQDISAADLVGASPEQATGWVDAMCVAAEVVSSRWQEGAAAQALLRHADCQSHAGLALGPWLPFEARDWAQQRCHLQAGAAPTLQGLGGHGVNDPAWLLLPWLRHATRQGQTLCAGSVVTTGAWLVALHLQPGTPVRLGFEGLGDITLSL